MLKKLLIMALAVVLFSCSSKSTEEKERKSASEVIDRYVETLHGAPKKAKELDKIQKERTEAEEKAIRELDQ